MARLVKLISFPEDSQHKVAGIKALRAAFQLGLKEAKDLIESLQSGVEESLHCVDLEALQDFVRVGGEVTDASEVLLDQIRATAMTAVSDGQYALATDLIEVLRKHS